MTVYMTCVFVANIVIGQHSKTFEWRYNFLIILGPLSGMLFYWIASLVLTSEISHLFANNFSITVIWYALLFSMFSTYLLDTVRQIYENFDKIEDNMPGKKEIEESDDKYKSGSIN